MTSGGTQVVAIVQDKHVRDEVREWVKEVLIRWYREVNRMCEDLKHTPINTLVIIIWDASLRHTPEAIHRLHRMRPEAKIVVVSPLPDWREARECFRAGAVDYLPAKMTSLERTKVKKRLRQWLAAKGE